MDLLNDDDDPDLPGCAALAIVAAVLLVAIALLVKVGAKWALMP